MICQIITHGKFTGKLDCDRLTAVIVYTPQEALAQRPAGNVE
ncbi:hypothetical protein [Anabaena subtropica]|nr:hypothetical protein [Anabaena subtropica]